MCQQRGKRSQNQLALSYKWLPFRGGNRDGEEERKERPAGGPREVKATKIVTVETGRKNKRKIQWLELKNGRKEYHDCLWEA
jgi:hypothetical protein